MIQTVAIFKSRLALVKYNISNHIHLHSDGIRFLRGRLSLPKNRSFALEFLLRLCEKIADMIKDSNHTLNQTIRERENNVGMRVNSFFQIFSFILKMQFIHTRLYTIENLFQGMGFSVLAILKTVT